MAFRAKLHLLVRFQHHNNGAQVPRKERSLNMAGDKTLNFTDLAFDQDVLTSDVPVLVDFWAPWCGPCRALAPTIDSLAARYVGKVKVGKLNGGDAQDIAAQYGGNSIPRVFIFKGGDKPRQSIVGQVHESVLAKAIDDVLQEK